MSLKFSVSLLESIVSINWDGKDYERRELLGMQLGAVIWNTQVEISNRPLDAWI